MEFKHKATLNQRVRSSSLRRPTILFNSCLVTAQTHGYFFRDSGTDHVSDCASGASMHQEAAIKFLDGSAFAYLLEFPKPPQLRRHCATPCENRRSALRLHERQKHSSVSWTPVIPCSLLPRPIIRHGHASKTLCFSVAPRARSERPLQGAIFHAVLERVRAESARRRWQMTYRLKTVRVQFIAEPESDERGCAPAV